MNFTFNIVSIDETNTAWRAVADNGAVLDSIVATGTDMATVRASFKTQFAAAFPTAAVEETEDVALKYMKDSGDFRIVDRNGKTLLSLRREANGGMAIKGFDDDGAAVHYSRQQIVAVQFRGTKTANVTWPVAFKRPPVISLTLTDASATVPYKYSATSTGAVIRLQNAYTGQIEVTANERA